MNKQKFINRWLDISNAFQLISFIGFYLFIGMFFSFKIMIPIYIVGTYIAYVYAKSLYHYDDITEEDFEKLQDENKSMNK